MNIKERRPKLKVGVLFEDYDNRQTNPDADLDWLLGKSLKYYRSIPAENDDVALLYSRLASLNVATLLLNPLDRLSLEERESIVAFTTQVIRYQIISDEPSVESLSQQQIIALYEPYFNALTKLTAHRA